MMILLFSFTTSVYLFLDRYKHASGDARYLGVSIFKIIVIFISNFAFGNLYNEDMLLQNLLMI